MNRASLLTQIQANSALITNKLSGLQILIDSSSRGASSSDAIKREKDTLIQENQALKTEIQSLVDRLNQLDGSSGPVAPVFMDKTSVVGKTPSVGTPPAPVAPSSEKTIPSSPKSEKIKIKKEQAKGSSGADVASGDNRAVDVSRLDFRVGRIITAKKHPDADSLYVEDVDLGEGKNRTVVSGLVKFIPIDQMQDRLVLLLCNLKPAKMRGVTSEAMVMCASTPEKVEILVPPENSVPGDRVVCQGFPGDPDPQLNPKKKIFEEVAPDLKTNDERIATYKGVPLEIPGKGFFRSDSLKNVQIK